jgi:hypothetical protein
MKRHRALAFCLGMISAQTLRGCREGKPLHIFPDHALAAIEPDCSITRSAHHGKTSREPSKPHPQKCEPMSHNHRGVTANETAGPGQTGRELQK